MRCLHNARLLTVIMLGLSLAAWGQGGSGRAGRGAAAQGPPAQQGGAGGRGAGAATGTAGNFYSYDTTASSQMAIPNAPPVETRQKITVGGDALAYTARAGYMPLRNPTTGQTDAHLFFTSYSRDGVSDAAARPIMFFVGGAPGVAAGWQEFGGFGPKRMKWAADGSAGLPPYGWVDNPSTLLGAADLVFVNPVGTGFSRPSSPASGPGFWNTSADIASLGEFVRGFLNAYERRHSPLFLAGEDFGTGRVAGLAGYLHDRQIPVRGALLLSITPSADSIAGDAQSITLMPSLTLAAWHHKRLAPELQALSVEQITEQARQFAAREYLHALYKGDRMTAEERTKAIANLARLTGLSKAFVVSNNLRISLDRFSSELLRDQHKAVSAADARAAGYLPGAGGGGGRGGGAPASAPDYFIGNLAAGFLTAYETYLRRELTFSGTGLYYLSSGGITGFTSTGNDDASLAGALMRNPRLRLFVGVNLFDLSAPFYATEFTLAHLNVSPEVRTRNITVSYFEAGQMPYVDNKASVKLQADLIRFINAAIAPERQ